MAKKLIDVGENAVNALAREPIDYIRAWWSENSTEAERTEADERGATIEGAMEFVENFIKRGKSNGMACLPDAITYEIVGVFMRNCVDGDEYATAEEIAEKEKREAERIKDEAERKEKLAEAKRKAEEAERERVAKMSEEERAAYEKAIAERKAKEEADKAERERKEAIAKEKEAEKKRKAEIKARQKALLEEMEKRQLTLF